MKYSPQLCSVNHSIVPLKTSSGFAWLIFGFGIYVFELFIEIFELLGNLTPFRRLFFKNLLLNVAYVIYNCIVLIYLLFKICIKSTKL